MTGNTITTRLWSTTTFAIGGELWRLCGRFRTARAARRHAARCKGRVAFERISTHPLRGLGDITRVRPVTYPGPVVLRAIRRIRDRRAARAAAVAEPAGGWDTMAGALRPDLRALRRALTPGVLP